MLVHWIWLATRPGMTDRMKNEVLRRFRDPEDAYYARAFEGVSELTPEAREALTDKDLTGAEKVLSQCAEKGIHILTIHDGAYPNRLKNIPDPPVVLYYKGTLPDLDDLPVIAVVGTRKASPYGLTMAKRLGYQLASCGGTVVSGLAYGIDGVAMAGALSAGGMVVGVLGSGADIVYPASNRSLFADAERRGCLLTEFPPGTPPHKWNFPKRNRIISGLCCGVLVVEAPKRSGALITARQAAEQGRDVFVLPGNADSPTCQGSNALLRDGGICVSSGWDVLSEYEALYPGKLHKEGEGNRLVAYPDEVVRAAAEEERPVPKVAQKPRRLLKTRAKKPMKDKKVIDKQENPPYSDVETGPLDETERTIVELLRQGDRLRDDVIAASGLDTGKVLSVLTLLEIKGIIRRLPGNRLSLK